MCEKQHGSDEMSEDEKMAYQRVSTWSAPANNNLLSLDEMTERRPIGEVRIFCQTGPRLMGPASVPLRYLLDGRIIVCEGKNEEAIMD
jgi:hypothetical protein